MANKRIALLLGQADEAYQRQFITGVYQQASKLGYDVLVFSMFIKYQNSKEREVGDSNIYSLINFKMFDAVILLSDTIQTPGVEKNLEERIYREFNGPVVCVDSDSKYFYNFWSDGYPQVYATVSHMIEEHDVKDIAYLTGRKNHLHSQKRLEAYKDAMKDHGLEIREDRIYYGDFWYTSGNAFAENMFHKGEQFPEAIVCANDCMAIGVAEELEKRGVKVPEDVLLAGYGTSDEGQLSPKALTSSYIPAEYYGSYAVEAIEALAKGEEVPPLQYEAKLFIGESCGCNGKPEEKYFSRRLKWTSNDSEEGFYSIHNYMLEDMLRATDLEEYFKIVYESLFYLRGVKRFEICLNSEWLNEDVLVDNDFPEEGYSHSMINILSYDTRDPSRSGISLSNTFETRNILPYINEDKESVCLIFCPIYVENKSFGYVMVSYGSDCKEFGEVNRLWLNAISKGLEALRRSYVIRILEKRNAAKLPVKFPTDMAKVRKTDSMAVDEVRELQEVEKILDKNLLTYHFQPIVNSIDGEIYSYEALMRSNSEWKIPPLQIIKHSDVLGRLSDIEKATFVNVLGIVGDNEELFQGKKVFINSIPGSRLDYDDFVRIEELLKKNSGKAVVELTEQAELSDDELEALKLQYRRMGIEMAVDDYGTGYSNVSNLLRYMPNYVKIDRSLLSEIHNSSQKQHFVREIVDFCHANNIMALAEGVETAEELRTVIRLGADLIQGYYVARPSAEILQSVDSNVKMEIQRFHREREDGADEATYIAGRTNRISISSLQKDNKNTIIIGEKEATFRDLTIVGTPNIKSELHIEVLEGYDGRVILENVSLSNIKNRPCIRLAENSKLTLGLEGENRLDGGGICVPETSKLTLEGDGNLKIVISGAECYGIGNGIDKGHGLLEFYQDGEVNIESSGQTAIGIGSGLGGDTKINKGKYVLHLNGDEGVGLGSLRGNQYLEIHDCDLLMDNNFYKGVCIGNLENNAGVNIWRTLLRLTGSGKRLSMVGTVDGERADIFIHDMSFSASIRAEYSTAIGSLAGNSNIKVQTAAVKYKGVGRMAFVYGGVNENTSIDMDDVDVHIEIDSDSGKLTNAPEENIKFSRTIDNIVINGEVIST